MEQLLMLSEKSRHLNLKNKDVQKIVCKLGMLARKAMLDEVYTTPKPGLVDCCSNGAHTDMDVHTFQTSAEAITPYLIQMAEIGAGASSMNADTFADIRSVGIKAEQAMYDATAGVNTHKGMIFSLGILVTCAAYCLQKGYTLTENTLFFLEQQLVRDTLQDEVRQVCVGGVRSEAIFGYQSVRKMALPVFKEGILNHRDYNRVKLQTLFTLMCFVEDSNVIARRGTEMLETVRECAKKFLDEGGAYQDTAIEKLVQMDGYFINENISNGGCADLLAVTIFVHDVVMSMSN